MDPDFWHDRWRRERIGFHLESAHWAIERYWSRIAGDDREPVLVPLCGKSLDMRWLAARGHPVTGIELSGKAVRAFFDEWGRTPVRTRDGGLVRWRAENVEVIEGDFFAWSSSNRFRLVYDRAALIALTAGMRPRYLRHLRRQLADDASGLLVTLEYDQRQMDGPPFAVPESELATFNEFRFDLLERRDVLAGHERFAGHGVTKLDECVYAFTAR